MKFIKIKLITTLSYIIILLFSILVYTLILYFGNQNIDNDTFRLTNFFITLGIFLLIGFLAGNIEQKKGWFAGSTTALIILIINFFVIWICNWKIDSSTIIKYLTFLLASSTGGIIGVNFKPIKTI